MDELSQNRDQLNIRFAIRLLDFCRSTYYRRSKPPASKSWAHSEPFDSPKPKPVPRTLTPEERETIRTVVYSDRFVDFSVYEIYFILLDEGIFHASIRTIYRVLKDD